MAEFGAHVATKAEPSRASIFELLAQKSLSHGLRDAFQYLINVLAEANPDRYMVWKKWSEEMYLLFDCIVQYSHLRAYKSSFSEHFYGLKRTGAQNQRLTPHQLWTSFLVVSLVPYARQKLDRLLDRLRHEDASHEMEKQSPGYYFIRVYPLICFLIESSNLLLQVSYALGKNTHYSIWCQVTGVHLVLDTGSQSPPVAVNRSLEWSHWLLAKYVAKTVGSCLSVGAFFIQFLEYYYAREGSVTGSLIRMPKPSPPVTSLYSRVKTNRLKDFCLLCNERRENDTVLSTSGYIYCYSCIKAFVARNKKCPATGIPSSAEHLIRLFPPQ